MIRVKRVYDRPAATDGERFLVDQLWPRGLTKQKVKVQSWFKEVAPSTALRKWYQHEPAKWKEFQRRYFRELDDKPEAWQALLEAARQGDITLVFSSREAELNNAVALKDYLEKHLKSKSARREKAAAKVGA